MKCYCNPEKTWAEKKSEMKVLPAGHSIFVNDGFLIYTTSDVNPNLENREAFAAARVKVPDVGPSVFVTCSTCGMVHLPA